MIGPASTRLYFRPYRAFDPADVGGACIFHAYKDGEKEKVMAYHFQIYTGHTASDLYDPDMYKEFDIRDVVPPEDGEDENSRCSYVQRLHSNAIAGGFDNTIQKYVCEAVVSGALSKHLQVEVPVQQVKEWKIPVNRVSVRQCVIAVTACDYEEAWRRAKSLSPDCDFHTGTEITCDYEIGEV